MSNALIVGVEGWDLGARRRKAGQQQTSLLRFTPPACSQGAGQAPTAGAKQTPAPSPSRSPPVMPKAGNRGVTVRGTRARSRGDPAADGRADQFETGLVPVPEDLRSSRVWGSCWAHLPLPVLLLGLRVCAGMCALMLYPG